MQAQPDFSALVTCYFEEKSIDTFHERLSSTLKSLNRNYEIIMVNDGSTDGTWDKLKSIFEKDPRVRVVMDLFRNSGQQAAITACINEARGRALILMDSDLQLDPEDLPALVREYDEGCDLVTGYRRERHDSFFRILPSSLANVIMRRATNSSVRDFGCTFKIYNGDFVRAFNYGPHHIFSNVELIRRLGRIKEVPVNHHPRKVGKSGYTFGKLWRYNMDNIMQLLERPFQYIAVACAALSVVFVLRLLISPFLDFTIMNEVSNGLLLNAIVLSTLITSSILALVGEFSVRNFSRVERLPRYIVRERIARADADSQS